MEFGGTTTFASWLLLMFSKNGITAWLVTTFNVCRSIDSQRMFVIPVILYLFHLLLSVLILFKFPRSVTKTSIFFYIVLYIVLYHLRSGHLFLFLYWFAFVIIFFFLSFSPTTYLGDCKIVKL